MQSAFSYIGFAAVPSSDYSVLKKAYKLNAHETDLQPPGDGTWKPPVVAALAK